MHLSEAGFLAKAETSENHAGVSERNICNRGRSKMGVQLGITAALRDQLKGSTLGRFSEAVHGAIEHAAQISRP
jgi:phage replication-related protein YjqB (UPF0714/DUF867 family)